MARSGLERRTPLAAAALVVAANVPDVDVLAYAWGPTSALAFRRGVTHGVLALVIWPFVVAAAILMWDRLVRRRLAPTAPPAVGRELALLAWLAVLTHPLLDFMNTYGMRWFMPFAGRWYYGDTLFITDPWVWGALAVGWYASGSRAREGRMNPALPARTALAGFAVYIVLMAAAGQVIRRDAARAVATLVAQPDRIMISPVPVSPFRRFVVARVRGRYRLGTYDVFRTPRLRLDSVALEPLDVRQLPDGIGEDPDVRRFLTWARYPYADIDDGLTGLSVHIGDARYTYDPEDSWAAVSVRRPR